MVAVVRHRVDRFVTDGVNFSVSVANYQIGVHLFYLLSHQTELLDSIWVILPVRKMFCELIQHIVGFPSNRIHSLPGCRVLNCLLEKRGMFFTEAC